MAFDTVPTINASQCRAARGLLGWTQSDLAREASLSKTSIVQFETSVTDCRFETLRLIGHAFNRYGIEFIPPFGVNRRSMGCRTFTDATSLEQDWPVFLQSLLMAQTRVRIVNWPELMTEIEHSIAAGLCEGVTLENNDDMATERAAFIGDWLILPVLDTGYRVALYQVVLA